MSSSIELRAWLFEREQPGLLRLDVFVLSLSSMNVPLETTDVPGLVRRAQQGDSEAFGELCRSQEGRLLRQAISLCGDVSLAEDLAQETLVEGWRCLGRFRHQCQFFTWLCAILLNRFRNLQRRKRPILFAALRGDEQDFLRHQLLEPVDPQSHPDRTAERTERLAHLSKAIAQLPAKHQEVVYLRFFVDESLEGIAGALRCSVGTVKSRLHYALKKLRVFCQDNEPWRPNV